MLTGHNGNQDGEYHYRTMSNQNSKRRNGGRRRGIPIGSGASEVSAETPYQSLCAFKSTEVLPPPIPHSAIIYGMCPVRRGKYLSEES